MKRKTVVRRYGYHVYMMDGRYYVDMHERNKPIHSYETLEGVKEALYYVGKIDSKTDEI